MLCPTCGANVGDKAVLCQNCAEQHQLSKEAVELKKAAGVDESDTSSSGQFLLFGVIGLGVILIGIVAAIVLSMTSRAPAIPLTAAQQSELEAFHARCLAVTAQTIEMAQATTKEIGGAFGKVASGALSLHSMPSVTERQCRELRQHCEHNYLGLDCEKQRQTLDLFYVLHNVCRFGSIDAKTMSSPECQALFTVCVGGDPDSEECRRLVKRHGA